MKALKEKRISLRSLLRRSLVILSLLALVFASCGDSSSSSDNGVQGSGYDGPPIVKVVLPDTLGETQYLARPINLRGVSATVYYGDGTTSVDTNIANFVAEPPIIYGEYITGNPNETAFVPMANCRVTYIGVDGKEYPFYLGFDQVVGIIRNPTENDNWVDPLNPPTASSSAEPPILGWATGSSNQGVMLTGVGSSNRQKKAFADAEEFSWSGLALEAEYYDDTRWTLSFNDVDWKVLPDYDKRDPATDISPGYLYVTVGKNRGSATYKNMTAGFMGFNTDGSHIATSRYADGITVYMPLDVVYTVSGINFATEPELAPFFYWEENSPQKWGERLLNAVLEVNYLGTSEVKRYSIAELIQKRPVWFNENPEGTDTALAIAPLAYPYVKGNLKTAYPKVTEKIGGTEVVITPGGTPGIMVYYRGHKTFLDIDVYTALVRIDAVSVDGDALAFSWDKQDNDYYGSSGTEKALMDRIAVTATYRAYNDTNKQETIPLAWSAMAPIYLPGTYYTDFSTVAYDPANEGKSKKLTINHAIWEELIAIPLTGISTGLFGGPSPNHDGKSTSVNVTWSGIK